MEKEGVMTPQERAIRKLESEGFHFSNWIANHPDAEGEAIGEGQTAVMVKRRGPRTEYREVEPDGTVN